MFADMSRLSFCHGARPAGIASGRTNRGSGVRILPD